MMDDQALYQEIGQLFFNADPLNAKKIIVRVNGFDGADGVKCDFNCFDDLGKLSRFDPGGCVIEDLTEILIKLRVYFLINNLTSGKSAWTGCLISLDIDKGDLEIDFSYGD